MSAGIEIYNYVSNQKGTPALYSDILANRPAAGFLGRLFISTDTLEIYRDTGTAWALISGGGGGSVNIYNSNGTLTAARTVTMAGNDLVFEGNAATNRIRMSADAGQPRIFSFASANVARWAFRVDGAETGSNAGGDWALRSYNDAGTFTRSPIAVTRSTGEKSLIAEATLNAGTNTFTGTYQIGGATYQAGLTMIGGNPHGAEHNNFTLANVGNLTFANSIYLGAQSNVLRLQANNSGTITMQPSSPGLRAATSTLNQIQYNTNSGAALTYTHTATMQGLGIYRLFANGSLAITNAYGLLLNDLNEYGYASTGAGALSITNRWGIYQDSTTDANYLGGSVLIGTTTNAGFKTDINGTFRAVSTVTLSSLGGVGTRMVVADASGVLSTQAIPGGGGGITGSGTTNYVAKFTGASSIGNSTIQDNGVNVGIGTAGLSGTLDIQRNSSTPLNTLAIGDFSNPALDAGIYLRGTTAPMYLSTAGAPMAFSAAAAGTDEVYRILPGKKMLIKTVVDAGYTLDVNGTLRTTQDAYFATTSGNVGIGLIAAGQAGFKTLEIGGTGVAGLIDLYQGTARQLRIYNSGTDAYIANITNSSNIFFRTTTSGGLQTDVLCATSTGNIGIGTTTPYSFTNFTFITTDGVTGSGLRLRNSGVDNAELYALTGGAYLNTTKAIPLYLGTNNATRLTITGAGGFVGISTTTPSVQLSLGSTLGDRLAIYEAGASLWGFGMQASLLQQYCPINSAITLGHGTSTSLTRRFTMFATSGNIGINTTTDSGQTLQVAGTARIFGTALPHLLIEQTAATGNVELQFSANAAYTAIIRTQTGQAVGFRDGVSNSNLDIYSGSQISLGGGGAPFGSTNTVTIPNGTAPTFGTPLNSFVLYSNDITAGNAAPHFITENGAIVKIYQETTSVAAATFTANTGTAINDASTFDGYTLRQIVKALRNLGILQ